MMKFVNLDRQRVQHMGVIEEAIATVCRHAQFILGPEVEEFEDAMAQRCWRKHAIACASGTDALTMALMVARPKGLPGTVLTSPFCFVATAEAAALLGMEILFTDIELHEFNLDPEYVWAEVVRQAPWWRETDGPLRTLNVIVVPNMFGKVAQWERFAKLKERGIVLIEDAAQSFGATRGAAPSGSFGDMSVFSFFPTKPLGCYGDGGMVLTDSDKYADKLRSIRSHGASGAKYNHTRVGMNSRLDTIQAAILSVKMLFAEQERKAREKIAMMYWETMRSIEWLSVENPELNRSAWAQFSILLQGRGMRDAFQEWMKSNGVPTMVHYPRPLNLMTPYLDGKVHELAMEASDRIVQLPCDAYMTNNEIWKVTDVVRRFEQTPMFAKLTRSEERRK